MTAAAGILHEEFHAETFSRVGGTLEMVQLWVNLPAHDKMSLPRYQTLLDHTIPAIPLNRGAGTLRLIAGAFDGRQGPALTFTPIDVWDIRLKRDRSLKLPLSKGRNVILVVLQGTLQVNGDQIVRESQTVLFDRMGDRLLLVANDDAHVLLLSGEPIDEPIAGYGPFVMNSEAEIQQAIQDLQAGRFGVLND